MSVRIIADVHEARSGIPALLEELGAEVEVAALPAGDYAVGEDTIVERKRVIDPHGSVTGRVCCMRRKQVYIDPPTERALKWLAAHTGRSESWHVRAALRAYLEKERATDENDPFLALIGLVDDPDGPDDVAVNHDHYLYGAPKVEP